MVSGKSLVRRRGQLYGVRARIYGSGSLGFADLCFRLPRLASTAGAPENPFEHQPVLGTHVPCDRRHLLQRAPSARTPRAASTSLSRGRPENLKYPAVLARSGRGTRRSRRQGKSCSPCSAVPRAFGEPGMPRRTRAIRARHSTLTASTEIA